MKLLEPIQVGKMTLKNRIMFPPLTTGYEERDGSIGQKSLSFYERLAKGGASYVVIGDVAPVRTASPTPNFIVKNKYQPLKNLRIHYINMIVKWLYKSSIQNMMFLVLEK